MPWENNAVFCILKDMLDTEQLVEIIDRAALNSNAINQCVACGEKDTTVNDEIVRTHTEDCLIGVIESYLAEMGFIEYEYEEVK